MNVDDILEKRALKSLSFESVSAHESDKIKAKELLQKEIYGFLPKSPEHFSFSLDSEDLLFAAGKAKLQTLEAALYEGERSFKFPFKAVIPTGQGKMPALIYIDSEKTVPNKFLPSEELADHGFAVFSFYYGDFSENIPKFNDGISSFLGINRHFASAAGKLMLWAYASMRIMDYVQSLAYIDKESIAVIGHSRLAEAALLAAAFDERFKYAIASCPSKAVFGDRTGANAFELKNQFSHWYSPRRSKISLDSDGYDCTGYLLSLIAPRKLMIGAAENDLSANHEYEFLTAYSVSKIYELYGLCGIDNVNELPTAPALLDRGSICYHIRRGSEYLSREDWHVYMNYINRKTEKKNDV